MMMNTVSSIELPNAAIGKYFAMLVNMFFKILPLKENGERSLYSYIQSLQIELLGCKALICSDKTEPAFLSLIFILQYFLDNPDCDIPVVKREVFKAISICKKLQERYADKEAVK